jgi:rhodanese-related sulfurtransferase
MPEMRTVETDEVEDLAARGAQLVEVLPRDDYLREHLAGAVSVPLDEIERAPQQLDRERPVVVYCFDHQCDLSPRAAARLQHMGFADVYDYADGKAAWLADGLPAEGYLRDRDRVGGVVRRDVPTVGAADTIADVAALDGDWELAVVTSPRRVVLGVVRLEATAAPADVRVDEVMQSAPATVRPSITRHELADSMDRAGQHHVLVTTAEGELIGLARRSDLDGP